jgi:hypothetical protein
MKTAKPILFLVTAMLLHTKPALALSDQCAAVLECAVFVGYAEDLASVLRDSGEDISWDAIKGFRQLADGFSDATVLCNPSSEEVEDAYEYGQDWLVRELNRTNEFETMTKLAAKTADCRRKFSRP